MADVRPLRALRYSHERDLADLICPPFDVISPEEQDRLYQGSGHNAVRLELPKGNGDSYQAAAGALREWLAKRILVRDEGPAFYLYRQEFRHGGETYERSALLGRLRLEPWDRGVVLPHELTFKAPKQDRLNLLNALSLNTSPIFLTFQDAARKITSSMSHFREGLPASRFTGPDGLSHRLWRLGEPKLVEAIIDGLAGERLYIADGHHRYETALAYRDQRLGVHFAEVGDEPERFTLVALVPADDPGLLVLPIHRLANVDVPAETVLDSLAETFDVETVSNLSLLRKRMRDGAPTVNSFGLVAAGAPDIYLLSKFDQAAGDRYLPSDRSSAWKRLDYAIANHVILRRGLGLTEDQMEDIQTVWFEEDAEAAVAAVRGGSARYAVLLNPVSPRQIIAVADQGERMPQKSTFFYPKMPTGLLFNPLYE